MRLANSFDIEQIEKLLLNDKAILAILKQEILTQVELINPQNHPVDLIAQSESLRSLILVIASELKFVSSDKPKIRISIGAPAHLSADTGVAHEQQRFDYTFAIGWASPGFFLNQGPETCGRILIVGKKVIKNKIQLTEKTYLMTLKLAQKWLPTRHNTDNKTRGGKLLVWAGQNQMPGAAQLATRAAMRSGTGYIYTSQRDILKSYPELLLWNGKSFDSFSAALVGPGLGVRQKFKSGIQKLQTKSYPVLLDADALTLVANFRLGPFPENWVLTPHAGELSRLLKIRAQDIEKDRLLAARKAQALYRCTVVLKGFHTVVAMKNLSVIIPTGNVALAKAGSGDVLSGLIASFMSQGLSTQKSALLGCYLHGWIADHWVRTKNDYLSLSPSDLIEQIPKTLAKLRNSSCP